MTLVRDDPKPITATVAAPTLAAEGAQAMPESNPQEAPAPRRAGAQLQPAAPRSRRGLWLGLAAAAGVVVIALVAVFMMAGRHRITTDDAQVEGHIVPLTAKVGGYVTQVLVNENQHVEAGQTLVELDDRELRAALAQADARLDAARAVAGTPTQTGEASARLSAAHANVEQAIANAHRADADLVRYRALAAQNVVSRQQLDQAVATAASANAQLAAARDQATAASAATRTAGGQVEGAIAARDEAALQLSYAHLVAPLAGVVSRKSVEVGQLVQPGQQLMNVVPLSDIWVVANLKETQLRGVTPGDPAEVHVDGEPGVVYGARVESLSPATGAKFSLLPPDNATGNFTKVVQRVPVRLRFVNANDPSHPLRPGLSVKVTIDTQGK
jgi:membrane fusion protein (multidrug efflux system)